MKYLPLVSDQVTVANRLFPSLITLNSRGILAPSQHLSPQKAEELRKAMSELLEAQVEKSTADANEASSESSVKLSTRFALRERLQFISVSEYFYAILK